MGYMLQLLVVDLGQVQRGPMQQQQHPMQPSSFPPNASAGSAHPAAAADAADSDAQHYQSAPGAAPQPSVMPGPPGHKMYGPPGQPPVPGSFPASVQAVVAAQQRNNRIAPVNKPNGLDPMALLTERENRWVMMIDALQ